MMQCKTDGLSYWELLTKHQHCNMFLQCSRLTLSKTRLSLIVSSAAVAFCNGAVSLPQSQAMLGASSTVDPASTYTKAESGQQQCWSGGLSARSTCTVWRI